MPRSQSLRALRAPLLLILALLAGARGAAAIEASPFGINIHAPQGEELAFLLDQAQAAGIGWVRIDFVWAYVETSPGNFDWSLYDAIAAAAQARGLEVFATLAYTPAWATSGPELTGVPDDPNRWSDFCFRAARRYRGSIRWWGLWNEANLPQFWAGSEQQYIDVIVKPGADAIHSGNPDAQVGGPELAHLTAGNSDWYYWLRDVLQQAGDRLNFVTHHVYDSGGNRNVTDKLNGSTPFANDPDLWTAVAPSVREVLKYINWDRVAKPLWLTETGWESSRVGESQQAAYYTGLLTDWLTGQSGQDWLAKIFFYEIKDGTAAGSSTWGILRGDRSAKPAYGAYRSFATAHLPSLDGALVVSDTFPATMEGGQGVVSHLVVKNTGTTTWTRAAGYALAADGDVDPFTAPRQLLDPGDSIPPGQQKDFAISLTGPLVPGTYTVRWRMVRDGVARFGTTFTKAITVAVQPPPGARRLALLSGRFTVEASWLDQRSGRAGYGRAVPSTDQTGFFWFFDPANVELVVKALDGRALNHEFWLFYGALSDVEYWVTVTDGQTGAVRQYHNPPGNLCGRGDTSAFPATAALPVEAAPPALAASLPASPPPATAAATCAADANDLCLLGGRYRVKVDWRDQHSGRTGRGTAVPRTDESGTFWFFAPANVELVVKVLDGTALNGRHWVFYGALSDVGYTITVDDLATGARKLYTNAPGNICGRGDTSAF